MQLLKPLILLTLLAAAATCQTASTQPAPTAAAITPPALLPQPAKYEPAPGSFTLTPKTIILTDPEAKPVAQYLANQLAPALGKNLKILDTPTTTTTSPTISLRITPNLTRLSPEGYTLLVTPTKIEITSPTPAGAFYACQTLRQLLPPEIESAYIATNPYHFPPPSTIPHSAFRISHSFPLPACTIEDQPHYPWRGMHLDCARHFFSKPEILRYIDLLAYYKMNVFHWHLTDDQAWRIEIKQYPRLTEFAAWRLEPPTSNTSPLPPQNPDGSPGLYGGFYSQADIREIVAYASARYVTIVPEIEMPAHSLAALSAYPELSCTGGPFSVTMPGVGSKNIFCAGKDSTFIFIDNVLDEVADLFPGPYIHVGGDECPKDRWKKCPFCQQRMKDNNLKNENELQSYFIKRIEAYLETKHKRLIGWDEILEGGLPQNATVTSWRGMSGGKTAAIQGHDVVMCPESNCYFDHSQDPGTSTDDNMSFLFESPVTLPRVYSFEPTPPDLTPEQAKHVLGAQGNVWSELIITEPRLDQRVFPREIALAECLWTHNGSYTDFAARLHNHLPHLDALNVHYYNDPLITAALIATWSPADHLPATPKQIDYNLTPFLTSPGAYTIRFESLTGKFQLNIDSVSLLENNKELMHDIHPGYTAQDALHNAYHITLDHLTPAATYTLRATLHADTPDTAGQIFLLNGKQPTQPNGPKPG